MTIKIGIIGYGYWGPNLLRNFSKIKNCHITAVADVHLTKLEHVKYHHPTVEIFASGQELLESNQIDAIVVATPASIHYALARQALEKGKHVLIEKPMTKTTAEATHLIELAHHYKKVLMVDHTFVYSAPVRKIVELIETGELGTIQYYDSVRINLGLFQNDVNVLWDLGPHDFSIMLNLINKPIKNISAVGSAPIRCREWSPESIVYVTIRFADKTMAHFHLNWLSPVKIRRTLISGSKKMVIYDHLDPDNQIKIFNKGVNVQFYQETDQALVQYRIGDMLAPKLDQTEALEGVCQEFIRCITYGETPFTSGEKGLHVVNLLQLAQESLENNGKIIQL